MRLIIAGGRDQVMSETDIHTWIQRYGLTPTEIISGGANGADRAGEAYAAQFNLPIKLFPADWRKHGKAAGPLRNKQMAEYADAVLLIWDGESRGSASMRREMFAVSKPVFEVIRLSPKG